MLLLLFPVLGVAADVIRFLYTTTAVIIRAQASPQYRMEDGRDERGLGRDWEDAGVGHAGWGMSIRSR